MKHKGAGDTVAAIAKATGADKVAKKIAKAIGKEDCGCKERQQWLNQKIPYFNTEKNCMNKEQLDQYIYLKEKYFSQEKTRVLIKDQEDKKLIINLYNSVNAVNVKGCESCNLKRYWDSLTAIYEKMK